MLKVCTWNVRRGIIKRELEIKELLKNEEINILFLTESDIILGKTDDYKIEGFTTVFQKRESENEKIRVVAFIKEDVESQIIVKENLMSFEVPSIWLELKAEHSVPFIICGVYREWAHNFDSSEAAQIKQMEEFASQIDAANETYEKVIITGDINLCSSKWADVNYLRKNIARPLLECINQHGLIIADIGVTYQADHVLKDGTIPESCLDHVYSSSNIQKIVKVSKLLNSSTDHLPVLIKLDLDINFC